MTESPGSVSAETDRLRAVTTPGYARSVFSIFQPFYPSIDNSLSVHHYLGVADILIGPLFNAIITSGR